VGAAAARDEDTVARVGADHFAIAVAACDKPADTIQWLLERIAEAFASPVVIDGVELLTPAARATTLSFRIRDWPAAHALDGIYHDPTGIDELYSAEPTERAPRDPMAGDDVVINATTWPIEPGQSVWVTWTRNGVAQTPIGAAWDYNSGNNSYWKVGLGSFDRGDQISYTVHADVNGSGQRSIGPFSFTVTSWSTVTDVTGYTDNGTSVDVHTGDSAGDFTPAVRLAFPTTDSFRTQIAPAGNGLDISGQSGYTVTDSSQELRIATSDLVLSVQKSPYRLSVYEGDGTTLITRQYNPATFRNIGWASDGATTVTKIEDHYLTPSGERFEGFGERYDRLDQRGHDVHNYVYNQYLDQGATGRTYLSVPFFTNSAGYGVYLPSTRYSVFNIGTHLSDMAGFTLDTGGALDSTLDYYVFTGSPDEIVDAYTAVSGRPQLPPKWAFGLWGSANEWNTQAEVENELANIDTHDIPHTAMVLEQWSDEATFYVWHGATYTPTSGADSLSYSDLTFPSGTAWSDPAAMVDDAHDQGIRVLLWQIPVLKQNFDTNPPTAPQQHINDRNHAQSQGYVVGDGSSGDYRVPSGQWFGDSLVPDFTSSDATDWWMSKRDYLLDEIGIDGFKTDGGELIFGRDVSFDDGRDGAEMHNEYPNTYTGAYNDYVQAKTGGDGALFSRAGTSGAQANSIFWAGDQSSTFGAFQEAIRAGISAGQSGVPFWAWDMAGFTGNFPSAELYLRSAAQATFSPIMQYHSEKANPSPSEARTPWNVQARTGNSSVIPTFRHFANVRMNLLPYIYTEAVHAADTGEPMMRAMSHEFPDDPGAVGLDQQYMFGGQLLVAPITSQGATSKDVYIPEGEWYDFWNGGRFTGAGVKTYGAGLDSIPVYVRPGAILPLNLNEDYELGGSIGNDLDTHTNLVFRIYPSGTSSYDYFDDAADTHRTVSVTENWAGQQVSVSVPALGETSTLQVASTTPGSVTVGGTTLTGYSNLAGLKAAAQGWYWDPVQQFTHVKLPSSGSARTVVLSGVDKSGYEAEFAAHTSVATNNNHSGYTGTGFVDQFASVGDAVEFQVNADGSGTHRLRFRYANAGSGTATRTVYVDGSPAGTLSLPAMSSWNQWGDATLDVSLSAGAHTVRLAYDASDSGGINLDHLVLARP
jgi:alpha-glucosidase (family GH31 glycosyl hydrolase)